MDSHDSQHSANPVTPLSLIACCVLGEKSHCVTLPKQKRLQETPNLVAAPMLAERISWVQWSWQVVERQHARSDGFTNTMERQCSVMLVQFGMGHCAACNDTFVVSKHDAAFNEVEHPSVGGSNEGQQFA